MVDFSVCNTNVNSCDFKDSKIYTFHFNSRLNFSGIELLVNGINIDGMEKEDALSAFKKLGVKFDKEDKKKFLRGESRFIIGKSEDYSFELETYDANDAIESIRIRMRV